MKTHTGWVQRESGEGAEGSFWALNQRALCSWKGMAPVADPEPSSLTSASAKGQGLSDEHCVEGKLVMGEGNVFQN